MEGFFDPAEAEITDLAGDQRSDTLPRPLVHPSRAPLRNRTVEFPEVGATLEAQQRYFSYRAMLAILHAIGIFPPFYWVVADVWEKDVWEYQAKSGSSGSCHFSFISWGKSQFNKCLAKRLEVPDTQTSAAF